jgi:hypothetical protein
VLVQAKYVLPISVKEHEKRFVVPFHDFAAQRFIGVGAKLFETVRSFPESHLHLSRRARAVLAARKKNAPKKPDDSAGDERRGWTLARHEQIATK